MLSFFFVLLNILEQACQWNKNCIKNLLNKILRFSSFLRDYNFICIHLKKILKIFWVVLCFVLRRKHIEIDLLFDAHLFLLKDLPRFEVIHQTIFPDYSEYLSILFFYKFINRSKGAIERFGKSFTKKLSDFAFSLRLWQILGFIL